MIFDSINLKLKGIMYLVNYAISKIHFLLFIIAESCKLCAAGVVSKIHLLLFIIAESCKLCAAGGPTTRGDNRTERS